MLKFNLQVLSENTNERTLTCERGADEDTDHVGAGLHPLFFFTLSSEEVLQTGVLMLCHRLFSDTNVFSFSCVYEICTPSAGPSTPARVSSSETRLQDNHCSTRTCSSHLFWSGVPSSPPFLHFWIFFYSVFIWTHLFLDNILKLMSFYF